MSYGMVAPRLKRYDTFSSALDQRLCSFYNHLYTIKERFIELLESREFYKERWSAYPWGPALFIVIPEDAPRAMRYFVEMLPKIVAYEDDVLRNFPECGDVSLDDESYITSELEDSVYRANQELIKVLSPDVEILSKVNNELFLKVVELEYFLDVSDVYTKDVYLNLSHIRVEIMFDEMNIGLYRAFHRLASFHIARGYRVSEVHGDLRELLNDLDVAILMNSS